MWVTQMLCQSGPESNLLLIVVLLLMKRKSLEHHRRLTYALSAESDDALGRRVVCDNVLKKWEPELAYLDGGYFNVTQLYHNAVMKQQ